nr:F0F1 ATP synthase subunit B [Staphylococcus sp. GDY8P86P]
MKVTATTNMFVLGVASGGGVQWGTIIVTIATFAILLLLLKKFAWGPLKEVMDKRERDINKDIDDAEQAKLNAQKLEAQNKQTLKETQEEVHKILEESKIQARKQHEEIIHEANIRANGMIETAQNEINSEKERALADINNQVSELSVLIASKVLQKEISEKDQKELVEKYIKEAGDK